MCWAWGRAASVEEKSLADFIGNLKSTAMECAPKQRKTYPNETLDNALRRFKRNCAKAGIQQEIRKREHYEKPSVRRKKKSEAARKRKY